MTMTDPSRIAYSAEPPVVGEHDLMSRAADEAVVPLCRKNGCTRAAGHDEGDWKREHPAVRHVVTDDTFTIREVH